jgi:putative membrane protein
MIYPMFLTGPFLSMIDPENSMNESENLRLAQERTDLAKERNSLANERTFLAWLRTGLGGIGGGVAVIRLLDFHTPAHKLLANGVGYFFILWGMAIFLLAVIDYRNRRNKLQLKTGYTGTTFFVCLLIGSLVAACAILLYIIRH